MDCSKCGGTGFIFSVHLRNREEVESAQQCECLASWSATKGHHPVSRIDIANAVAQLTMCPFFPASDVTQQAVMSLLERMVSTREQLGWLVGMMINHVGKWHGPAELRGLFCTRFTTADGIQAICTIPGYRLEDFEARSIAELGEYKAAKVIGSPITRLLAEVKSL